MKTKNFTVKEWIYYLIRVFCILLTDLPFKVGNWATKKLNKIYYKIK
jgi:hypothetical protein